MKISDSLRHEIEVCVEGKGAAVVDIVVRGSGKNPVFEIFVDNEEGVTLDICRELSRELQPVLDRTVQRGSYGLTVSSPGIDRPLRHSWQLRKHVGRTVEVTVAADERHRIIRGKLSCVSGDRIVLAESDTEGDMTILFAEIVEARVRAPW